MSSVSGGAVSYVRNMAPLLEARFRESPEGHSLTFLAHADQRDVLKGVDETRIIWTSGKRPIGYRRVLWELANMGRIVRREGVDVLFNPYQIGCSVRGPKRVLVLQNMEPFLWRGGGYAYALRSQLRNYLLNWASRRSLRRADRVIAISQLVREHLINGVGVDAGRIRMIYHGRTEGLKPDGDAARDRDALKRLGVGDQYILTCGSLFPYRRCEDVIEAFTRCADGLQPGMQLVIAGSGFDKRYGRLIDEAIRVSPFCNRILELGHVSWEAMVVLYRRCHLCVIATEIEACPTIAIEAMAMGCSIVSADRAPLPELFQGAALYYPARDIDHLVAQMRAAMDRPDLRMEMRGRALKRAEDFSWVRCANETYAALTTW
jgi:glycosyltransferase involved in cell wall biosynthesis